MNIKVATQKIVVKSKRMMGDEHGKCSIVLYYKSQKDDEYIAEDKLQYDCTSGYTIESQQDLKAIHGQDIETMMMDMLTQQIRDELDREILAKMMPITEQQRCVSIGEDIIAADPYTMINGLWIK